jgi:hypothetical protein
MPGVVSHLLKRWRDDFATVKCRGMVSGLIEKKRDAIPPHFKHWMTLNNVQRFSVVV